jgi:PhzF family phenazine biosynthesis protein
MNLELYQVDAFTSYVFGGNPAAVCILESWLKENLMQSIASENNLSETAFVVPEEGGFSIRWFTPQVEVDLCGHATLATAHVLFNHLHYPSDRIQFNSLHSGLLAVEKEGELLTLDFPSDTLQEIEISSVAAQALGKVPLKAFEGKSDFMFIYHNQTEIEQLTPDFGKLARLGGRGIIVTSMGHEVDFVSRFFAPQTGINEDPVTGSAHTTLTPYWAKVLDKNKMQAHQLSERGGELVCEYRGERVGISGRAVTYMKGILSI